MEGLLSGSLAEEISGMAGKQRITARIQSGIFSLRITLGSHVAWVQREAAYTMGYLVIILPD